MQNDEATRELLERRFAELWNRLKIQRHITLALSKKQNSKQALEKAEHFHKVTRVEIIDDLTAWYRLRNGTQAEQEISHDLLDRINGELAALGVPFIAV